MKIDEFIKKHFWSLEEKEKMKIKECLEKGTVFKCFEPECGFEWTSKPGEVFEKCPKCGSNRILFKCGEIWNAVWHDGS